MIRTAHKRMICKLVVYCYKKLAPMTKLKLYDSGEKLDFLKIDDPMFSAVKQDVGTTVAAVIKEKFVQRGPFFACPMDQDCWDRAVHWRGLMQGCVTEAIASFFGDDVSNFEAINGLVAVLINKSRSLRDANRLEKTKEQAALETRKAKAALKLQKRVGKILTSPGLLWCCIALPSSTCLWFARYSMPSCMWSRTS